MSRRLSAAWAGACVVACATTAWAQPAASPVAGRVVAVVPFTGGATAELNANIEAAVRGALLARGASVPSRDAVMVGIGMTAPTDALGWARVGRGMSASDVIRGEVRPLAGQFNLTLTRYESASGRAATAARNVGEGEVGDDINAMVDALYDPANLGPAPEDPDARAREEEARRQREAEERRRAEEAQRDAAARAAEAERRRQEQYAREHPVALFDQGGPFAVGASLTFGGLLSGVREAPSTVITGNPPEAASSFAMALRVDGAYSIRAVRGLEVVAQLGLLVSPTTAVMLGAGAQFTFPASARLPLRGVGGFVIGLFQGATGARATTVWLSPYARAEWAFSQRVSAFAGVSLDVAPAGEGGVTTLGFTAGARFRFGG